MRRIIGSGLLLSLAVAVSGCSQHRTDAAREVDGLFLTWQQDPTTSMTIQWLHPRSILPLVAGQSNELDPMDVPHVGQQAIDGNAAEWWDRGLDVRFIATTEHQLPAPDDFQSVGRIAWNDRGLLVALKVNDPIVVEADDPNSFWEADSIELFVSDGVGSGNRYQVLVSAGVDEGLTEPQWQFYPKAGGPAAEDLTIEAARERTEGGYEIEVLLPWSNLPGFEVERGMTAGFQVILNDRDEQDSAIEARHYGWHPLLHTASEPGAVHPLRLADRAAPPQIGRAVLASKLDEDHRIEIYALPDQSGRTVTLAAGDRELASTQLTAENGVARATFALPESPQGRQWGVLDVRIEDEHLAQVQTPAEYQPVRENERATLTYWPADADERQAKKVTAEGKRVRQWPGQYLQRVELTGLKPDTVYNFRAANDPRVMSFQTMPADLNRPLRIAVGGDTRHERGMMYKTNSAIMKHDPDFIVWGGDLAYANAEESNLPLWVEWFEVNDATLIGDDGRVTPVVLAIGNHETRGGLTREEGESEDDFRLRRAPYFYQFFAFPGQPGYKALDFGEYLSLVILDTNHTNPVEGEQTRWLEQTLAERQEVTHLIPVYHVPAYPSVRDFDGPVSAQVRDLWLPLFERFGVRVAFENHDHAYKRTHPIRGGEIHPEGIVYIGDGAWGVATRAVHDPKQTWYLANAQSIRHGVIMTLDGASQHFLVISEDGAVIDEYTTGQPLAVPTTQPATAPADGDEVE